MTHVTVDARMLNTAGIGTYLRELLPRVISTMNRTRFTLLGDKATLTLLAAGSPRVSVRQFSAPIYSIREQWALVRVIPRDTSLFWAPHFNIPLCYRERLVVTVHDVAHLALSQTTGIQRLYARLMFAAVRRRAACVLFDSEFTSAEFARRVGAPRSLAVCRLGVSPRWFERVDPDPPLPGPYFLFVGNVKPHKNLGRLIDAFAEVASDIPHQLVIVGRQEGMRTIDHDVARRAADLGDRVAFTGYVAQEAVEQLVRGCDALVLPSLYEGFGLPPLEALACGRAVAVSNVASLPEVCGPVAEYFDPLDTAAIAGTLLHLATRGGDTGELIERRREWARQFDWDACARATVASLSRALPAHRGDVV